MPDGAGDDAKPDDTPVPQGAFSDAIDRLVAMINELKKMIEAEASERKIVQASLWTSIKNVQTQLLEKQGRFDPNKNFGGTSTTPDAPSGPKLRFPKFDGTSDPLMWLHKGEQFFHVYDTTESQKVWTAAFYMDGSASQWYYRWGQNLGATPSWEYFTAGVNRRFGPPLCSNPLGELSHLRRTGSMDEHQESFLNLLARCQGVTEKHQIALFTAGLLLPLSVDVEMHNVAELEDAMALARAYECRLTITDDMSRTTGRPSASFRSTPRSVFAPMGGPTL